MQILTYHNVMPTFLEFVFPFGQQHFPRDFHLMGFRSESQLARYSTGLQIDNLGRSGRHLEFCYSLKSVERASEKPIPWSVRQCSVYHHLDLTTGQSVWIVVKANKVISEAMQRLSTELLESGRKPSPLAASIELHKIMFGWISESWHWYINDLECYLQDETRGALSTSAEPSTPYIDPVAPILLPSRTESPPPMSRISSMKRNFSWRRTRERTMSGSTITHGAIGLSNFALSTPAVAESSGFENFSFRDLQIVHFVEEKTNEALLILRNDITVLRDFAEEYRRLATVLGAGATPQVGDYESTIADLDQLVNRIERHLDMQISRLTTLLSVTADRKSLVSHAFCQLQPTATKCRGSLTAFFTTKACKQVSSTPRKLKRLRNEWSS